MSRVAAVIALTLLASRACGTESRKDVADQFISQEGAVIEQHAGMLRVAGRMPDQAHLGALMVERELGAFGWHADRHGGYFGAYAFSPAAFEQAQRTWWIHGTIAQGSDVLR